MAHKRALKPKNVERLNFLQNLHPGELTPELKEEMDKLLKLRSKYGNT